MADSPWQLVLSCEHGGNRVPAAWGHLFCGRTEVLATHRGYDIGIAPLARRLAERLRVPLHLAEVTRLLVELNRSPGHPALFSEFSRSLAAPQRQQLLETCYQPYREALTIRLAELLASGERVIHLSLHSFTPELNGEIRNADIGLLYDPKRHREKRFCLSWQRILAHSGADWRVRRNYPYRGAADSIVTSLRRHHPAAHYLGLELELNQLWPKQGGARWEELQELVCGTLKETLELWRRDAR